MSTGTCRTCGNDLYMSRPGTHLSPAEWACHRCESGLTPPVGSISHGTLRTADLLSAFLSALERYDPGRPVHFNLDELLDEEWVDAHPEEAGWALEDLFRYLEDYAPVGCYFGAHEGDGSDFGFWPLSPE